MNLGMNCGGSGSKLTTSPQIWCRITMQKFQCSCIQLYRKSINIKVVKYHLVFVNVYEEIHGY